MCSDKQLAWLESSYSAPSGDDCVEIAVSADRIHVRDSKSPTGSRITLSPLAWKAFVGAPPQSGPALKSMASLPLTPAAVRELLSLPLMERIPEDRLDEAVEDLGWEFTDLVCDADRTRHGHVLLGSDCGAALGDPEGTFVLTFANIYPEDWDGRDSDTWSNLMERWGNFPGWNLVTDPTMKECEAVFEEAASVVAAELGPPLRTVRDISCLAPGLPYYLWRVGNHGVALGPCPNNGPYGYLTMGVLAICPWPADEALPRDESSLAHWIRVRIEI